MTKVGFLVTNLGEDNGLRLVYDAVSNCFDTVIVKHGDNIECELYITNIPEALLDLPEKVFYIFTDIDGGTVLSEQHCHGLISHINRAEQVFTYSKAAAAYINDFYKVKCIVDTPAVPIRPDSSGEYILYYNIPSPVIEAFPNEKFVPFHSVEQFERAKLYLHKPIANEYFNLRLLFASANGVPTVYENSGAAFEFKSEGDISVSVTADTRKWIQSIKVAMKDRHINSKLVRNGINRYSQNSEIVNNIRKYTKSQELPKHVELLKSIKDQDKIKRMLAKRVVGKRYRRVTEEESKNEKIIINKEGRRRGISGEIATSSIFLSGGIGDVIALEAYFSNDLRKNLETIYYATHKWESIKALFDSLPNYPKLKRHISVWEDFSSFWCFLHKGDCTRALEAGRINVEENYYRAPDYGIAPLFAKINQGIMKYNVSSFCMHKIANVEKFTLPSKFLSICPYSTDKRIVVRDFNDRDWDSTVKYLEASDAYGVVLNNSDEHVPESPNLINLSNQTTISEAIEIVKKSIGYVGIDSALSVVAAKTVSPSNMVVKSHNMHLFHNKNIYYSPLKYFDFINTPEDRIQDPKCFRNLTCMREITITTVQGLGDIFWVYQKLSPHFDRINLNILIVSDDHIQKRSEEWVKLFPKVSKVTFQITPGHQYDRTARLSFSLEEILENWEKGTREFTYAVNSNLESGTRIDEIDGRLIETDVPVICEDFKPNYEEYIVLYISGAVKQLNPEQLGAWTVDYWVELVDKLFKQYNKKMPVIVIGATFDAISIKDAKRKLVSKGIENEVFMQAPPARVLSIIKNAKAFIGFQSGLNIMADNYDVKQIMIYYNILQKMLYTWCKKKNIGNIFNAFTFSNSIEDIIKALPGDFL